MKAGDVLLYSGKTAHGGGANLTTDQYRRGVAFAFNPGFLTGEEAYPFRSAWTSFDSFRRASSACSDSARSTPSVRPASGRSTTANWATTSSSDFQLQATERTVIKQPQAALVNGQHLDFIVVGAGISGLGATYNTHKRFPDHSFAVLEAMDGFGALVDASLPRRAFGQRLLHLRLQLQALGNRTRHRHGRRDPRLPGELIEENDLARHIHYGHKITAARWSSRDRRWTLEVTRTHSGETLTLTTGFLDVLGLLRSRQGLYARVAWHA